MASAIRLSFHKRLFLLLMAFSWGITLCFVAFQYVREKEYKTEFLHAQLQQYNLHVLEAIERGEPCEEYMATQDAPFENLRVTFIAPSGTVVCDNTIESDSWDNHRHRPEIAAAIRTGAGCHIRRQSASDGREYFYSATRGELGIVRTAIPYSSTLYDLLEADWTFLLIMLSVTLAASVAAFFTTRQLGKDIERMNRYEAEQERTRLKRQLTNNINHELKTPVASIQICLETLLSGINLSEEKRQELIGRCYTQNERLRRLLHDVSLITRLEDGTDQISREPVSINNIINEIAIELDMMPEEKRHTLHIDFSEEVIIEGNLALVCSIFSNLIENAITYSEGKNIYISLLRNNQQNCHIRFEDDGKGVKPDQLPRLFERFYRVDKGRSRQRGGTGLGLAIVKHAVLFHGGTITASNRPDGGLRFDFSLQKAAQPPQPKNSKT